MKGSERDHKLSNKQYYYLEYIWPAETKVVQFVVPLSEETGRAQSIETRGEVATLETVQKMLQKQKKFKLEMQEDLNRSHLEIITEQREMNKQLMEGLDTNLGQMLQAQIKGGNTKLPCIQNCEEDGAQISKVKASGNEQEGQNPNLYETCC